jgi:hypothetical protein
MSIKQYLDSPLKTAIQAEFKESQNILLLKNQPPADENFKLIMIRSWFLWLERWLLMLIRMSK